MQIPDRQPGTYALLLHCARPDYITVGRLDGFLFASGYWVYVGSAFGPGGLRSRLAHHLRPSLRPHWHQDYVKTAMHPVEIWTTTDTVKREHAWAAILSTMKRATRPIPGFGSSDCDCDAHLIHMPKRPDLASFRRLVGRTIDGHGPIFQWKNE